jgi:hypothetical protein
MGNNAVRLDAYLPLEEKDEFVCMSAKNALVCLPGVRKLQRLGG